MTATFWTGSSLTFTNGSDTVTVNTGPSLDSVKPNSSLKAGNYNEPVEIKSVNGNVITLFENWPGSTGNTSATITPSAATAASAGAAAQSLIAQIQSLINSASITATPNSFPKRDSAGRLKTATPSASDDAVNKGYLGTAAQRNAGTSAGNLMEVGAFGHGAGAANPVDNDCNKTFKSGNYFSSTGLLNGPVSFGYLRVILRSDGDDSYVRQEFFSYNLEKMWFRNRFSGTWSEWQEIYHSANTNFNEFGGVGVGDIVCPSLGYASNSSTIVFTLPINSKTVATGITATGTFRLYNIRTGIYEETGLTARFNGGGVSSNRVAFIDFIGLSGKTRGDIYLLASDADQTSKIKVNF